MTGHSEVEILLVEDNPSDVELTLRALKTRNLANQVFVARDGAEALEFFFGEQSHPLRDIGVAPRVRSAARVVVAGRRVRVVPAAEGPSAAVDWNTVASAGTSASRRRVSW